MELQLGAEPGVVARCLVLELQQYHIDLLNEARAKPELGSYSYHQGALSVIESMKGCLFEP
jgi:hypothetical protein